MNWQHLNILAATNYLRERLARGAPDARAKEVYDGLLDVLDPSRRDVRLTREAAVKAAEAAPPVKAAKPARRRHARAAAPAKRPRR